MVVQIESAAGDKARLEHNRLDVALRESDRHRIPGLRPLKVTRHLFSGLFLGRHVDAIRELVIDLAEAPDEARPILAVLGRRKVVAIL